LLHDSPEFVSAFVAIQMLGAIAVPINMGLKPEEQRAILNNCTAAIAVVEASICNSLLTDARNKLRHLQKVLVVTRTGEPDPKKIDGVITVALSSATRQALTDDFPASVEHDTPSFILYTSGSTGEPKGAVHCQADIFYTNETFCKQVLTLQAGDRLFSSSRLPFAYGLGNAFSFPLLNGCTSVLCLDKPAPEVISNVFARFKPTIFFAVPVIYKLLLDHNRQNPIDCSSLRLCISAGEALPAHLGGEWQRTFNVEALDGIGSTEMLHMWMSNFSGEVCYGSSGKLLHGYHARLLNQEGLPVASGEAGNLWVQGASAASGYWERPEATASTFVDGWVRTGDLYSFDPDGYWYHLGRSDDCFKSSGQWVSPVEVEGVLSQHHSVHTSAVVQDFDETGLPAPCAFILRANSDSNDSDLEAELRALSKDALPRFKRPRKYLFVSELPYTATGKIQRFKLREQLLGADERG
jgi:benzoate-CoA ligase